MKKGLSVMAKKLITIVIIFIILMLIFLMSCGIYSVYADRHNIRSRCIHPIERKISRECQENLTTEYKCNPGSKITMDSIE